MIILNILKNDYKKIRNLFESIFAETIEIAYIIYRKSGKKLRIILTVKEEKTFSKALLISVGSWLISLIRNNCFVKLKKVNNADTV